MKANKHALVACLLSAAIAGCMSMEEKLASDSQFWRDIGETEAVSFALDAKNPLEKRLDIAGKIANQQKLAKIAISRNVAPEVKSAVRKRIDQTPALADIALGAPERQDQMDALKQLMKSEDSRIEAAWIFAERKPSSSAPQTFLEGLSNGGKAGFARTFAEKFDAVNEIAEEAERIRQKFGNTLASRKQDEAKTILKSLVRLAPFVEDEKTLETLLQRQDVAGLKGTQYDVATPLAENYVRIVTERKAAEAKAEAERIAREHANLLAALDEKEARELLLGSGSIEKDGKRIVSTTKRDSEKSGHEGFAGKDAAAEAYGRKAAAAGGGTTINVTYKAVLDAIAGKEFVAKINADIAKRDEAIAAEKAKEAALAAKYGSAFDKLVKAGMLKEHDTAHCGDDEGSARKKFELAAEYIGKVTYYEGNKSLWKWSKSIELFKDDHDLQQRFAKLVFNQIYTDYDNEQRLPEIKKVLAAMPAETVVRIFKSGITDKEVDLRARACAYAITDQKILKALLVDDDSWARPKVKNSDLNVKRRRNIYVTLLENVADAELADKIFFETRLTKNTDVICLFDILDNLTGKISEARRKEITDRAIARSAEAAKTTVVVKQYYVGMSCLDYTLINYANGKISSPGLSSFDDSTSRKMTKIGFTKNNRIRKLDITQDNVISACEQFAALYGKVPDGKDVSGKTDIVSAIRSKTTLESYSSKGVWKWIDYVHNVQAEVDTNEGNLVLCAAEIEGQFNNKDTRKEEQDAIIDLFAGGSSDDNKDMGPDPGLDPAGK